MGSRSADVLAAREFEPASLAQRFADDEPGTLDECYRVLAPRIRGYIGRFVAHSEIDDVVQRVFWELWRVRDRYDPKRSLEGWVMGIAHKRTVDHIRRTVRGVVPLDRAADVIGDDGREQASSYVARNELGHALDELPAEQSEPIRLAYFDGYSQREIAALLHVPIGTVKSRTARGLQRLSGLVENPAGAAAAFVAA